MVVPSCAPLQRDTILISEISVQIRHGNPPSFSGGYFHWFTSDGRLIVAYDPSSLDEEDDYHGRLLLQEKKHVVSVIQSPVRYSSKIVWRSDNRQTMWFAQSRLDDGVEVFRTPNDSDDWTCISSVGMDAMMDVIIGITEKDKENEVKISGEEIEEMSPDRMMVWLIAFVPWNLKLVILRHWDRIYRQVMVEGDRHYTDITYEWYPYFHTFSTSQVNFLNQKIISLCQLHVLYYQAFVIYFVLYYQAFVIYFL
jgi:hypothetical protein